MELDKLETLKNRAARTITNSPSDSPSKTLVSNLPLESIRELIDYEVAVMTFTSLNDLAPLCLKNLFTRNSHYSSGAFRNTQSDPKLPLKKTSIGQNGFSFRGTKASKGLSAAEKRRHQ